MLIAVFGQPLFILLITAFQLRNSPISTFVSYHSVPYYKYRLHSIFMYERFLHFGSEWCIFLQSFSFYRPRPWELILVGINKRVAFSPLAFDPKRPSVGRTHNLSYTCSIHRFRNNNYRDFEEINMLRFFLLKNRF